MIQISKDNESGRIEHPTNESSGGISHLDGNIRDADSLSSETKIRVSQSCSTHELSNVETKFLDSDTPFVVSDVLETIPESYALQNTSEPQPSELMVCVEVLKYPLVKDACVDDKTLSRGSKDDQHVASLSEFPPENHSFHEEGEVGNQSIESNGLATRFVENTEGIGEDEGGYNELSNSNLNEVLLKSCDLETDADFSGDKSSVEREVLPIQENCSESSLASLFTSFDGEEDKSIEQHHQTAGTLVSEIPCASFTEAEKGEGISIKDTGSKDTGSKDTIIGSIDQSNELSLSRKVPFPRRNNRSSMNDAIRHDHRNSDDSSIASNLLHYNEGDSSFSAAGLVTYSGPITFSGSLSVRSDGSATSGKSFAFPILQSEWNSSPIRMEKANRRRFWQRKSWKSGLSCFRF